MFLIFLSVLVMVGAIYGDWLIDCYIPRPSAFYPTLMKYGVVLITMLFLNHSLDHSLDRVAITHRVILLWFLLAIGIIDGVEKVIPNKLVLLLIGIGCIFMAIEATIHDRYWVQLLVSHGLGLLGGGGLFLLAHIVSGHGIGMGDVKLIGALGLNLGFHLLLNTLVIILLMSAIYSLFLVIRKRASLKDEIPFAPFVFAGTFAAFMLGV